MPACPRKGRNERGERRQRQRLPRQLFEPDEEACASAYGLCELGKGMTLRLDHCHIGDCRSAMRAMIAEGARVQTIVTSPPYWGLRDYGVSGQIGQEDTLREYVATMVKVFALARELLADDGTLWLNLGDRYVTTPNGSSLNSSGLEGDLKSHAEYRQAHARRRRAPTENLRHKNLVGIPWRVAFALQDDGWILRQDIIWHKPNPMPESVTDRCTKAHESCVKFQRPHSRTIFSSSANRSATRCDFESTAPIICRI